MKHNWTGTPTWNPKIAAGSSIQGHSVLLNYTSPRKAPNDTAYFSWNGATDLVKWIVLASHESVKLTSIDYWWTQVPKVGFETSVQIGKAAEYVRAVAVGADDQIMAASLVLDMRDGSTKEQSWDSLDFTAQQKTSLENDEEESAGLVAQYNALKQDWRNLRNTTRSVLMGVLSGSVFAIFILIFALSWRYRRSCAGVIADTKRKC